MAGPQSAAQSTASTAYRRNVEDVAIVLLYERLTALERKVASMSNQFDQLASDEQAVSASVTAAADAFGAAIANIDAEIAQLKALLPPDITPQLQGLEAAQAKAQALVDAIKASDPGSATG